MCYFVDGAPEYTAGFSRKSDAPELPTYRRNKGPKFAKAK